MILDWRYWLMLGLGAGGVWLALEIVSKIAGGR